jgi:DNA-binding CsgD family transcriptional regulator
VKSAEQIPGVVATNADGKVVSQNRAARNLMGNQTGKFCWDAFSNLKGAEGLPCRNGCALQLLADGMDTSQHTSFRYEGQRHHLSCVPVDGTVVCTLTRGMGDSPEAWQSLTPRERAVLELLASGETTVSAAVCLGLSEATIRTHVEKVRAKLGVNTRAAAVACGFRLGYLD